MEVRDSFRVVGRSVGREEGGRRGDVISGRREKKIKEKRKEK